MGEKKKMTKRKPVKKVIDHISSLFIGVLVVFMGAIVCSVLFYGIVKADNVEANQIEFKDSMLDLISNYKDFTVENVNSLRQSMNKNAFYVNSFNKILKEQQDKIDKQDDKLDSVINNIGELKTEVLIAITKLNMQDQIITIEESKNNGK